MVCFRLTNWKWLVLGSLVAVLVLAVACGADETEAPAGITAEEVKSAVEEVVGDQVSAEDIAAMVKTSPRVCPPPRSARW